MDEKIEAFREMTERELKAIRLNIGNVGSLTTETQRSNIISDIKQLEHRLKAERSRQRIRAGRNENRASKRITAEGKEKYNDRSSFYWRLANVIETYLIKVKYLFISARNQFEKYKIELVTPPPIGSVVRQSQLMQIIAPAGRQMDIDTKRTSKVFIFAAPAV